MTDTEWLNIFQETYNDLYQESPDIRYLETLEGSNSPLELGERIKDKDQSILYNIYDYWTYGGFDPNTIARQTIEAVIKIGTIIGLCNLAVAKLAKTSPSIAKSYTVKYFVAHHNVITIFFENINADPITISINYVKFINEVYKCMINGKLYDFNEFPDALKKIAFGK